MECVCIDDPEDRSFPFSKSLFEDREILYHGTWSTYISGIESAGLAAGALPFDHEPFLAISKARKAIGWESFFNSFYHPPGKNSPPSRHLYFSGSFWSARAYATNGGGEAVGATVREAVDFERVCTVPEVRASVRNRWEEGLRAQGDHPPTRAAVEMLKNDDIMHQLHAGVVVAREALMALGNGGYPTVYAIRVDPTWFGEGWEDYLYTWEAGLGSSELRCSLCKILPDRLVGKVLYPHGTDRDFNPTFLRKWSDVLDLKHR